MISISEKLAVAIAHHHAGRLHEAEELYREILELHPDHSDALHLWGLVAYQAGNNESAGALIADAIAKSPQTAEFHNSAGLVAEALGRREAAFQSYLKAVTLKEEYVEAYHNLLRLKPDYPEAYFHLGTAYYNRGEFEAAADGFRQALRLKPDYAEAHYNLGVMMDMQKKPAAAIEYYGGALKIRPDYVEAHYNLGNALMAGGDPEAAEKSYRRALRLQPGHARALTSLGMALEEQGRTDAAIESYSRAIGIEGDYAVAHFNLGNILSKRGGFEEAIRYYGEAVKFATDFAEAYNNMGTALMKTGDLDAAIRNYKRVLSISPDHARACYNIGVCLEKQGLFDEATERYRQAIRIAPEYTEAHCNLGLLLMLKGALPEGMAEYQWRVLRPDWKEGNRFPEEIPLWKGLPFRGKTLLIRSEQGIGDTFQFVRYMPMIKALGGTVVFETNRYVSRLLKGFEGVDLILEHHDGGGASLLPDYQIPLLSLPGIFHTTLETIPSDTGYIRAEPEKIRNWGKMLTGAGFKIGLVWAGNPGHTNDKNRSCPLELFAPLLDIPSVEPYGLQKGEASVQAENLPCGLRLTNLGDGFEDFSDTAGVIANLDLVISVDTSVAHLAGAMGKPVWTLLPFSPDWRWLLHRKDSPWYPTMRLWRQQERGGWHSVFRKMGEALQALVERRRQ